MKKLLSVLLITVLLCSCAGCRKNTGDDEYVPVPDVTDNKTQQQQINKEETKQQADNLQSNDEEIKIEGSVSNSHGISNSQTVQTEQPEQQKLLGVFPDSMSESERQTLKDIANSKKPFVTVSKRPDEFSGYWFYYQAKAKELIELIASFEYTGDICRCPGDNVLYIGDNLEFAFYLKKHEEGGNYESIEHGGTSHTLTAEQGKKITQLVEAIFDEKNYKSIEGKENTVEIMQRIGNSFVWYSFKNADSDRLISIMHNIEVTQPKMTEGIEYRFNGMFFKLALNCEKPYITARDKSAYLTDGQIKEIKDILSRNCTEKNIKDNPDNTMPAFIKDLRTEKLYSFTNETSAFLIDYIVFSSYENEVECDCELQYEIYSHFYIYKQKNKDIVNNKYNIGFSDGIVHLKSYGETHYVLSQKDSEYIKQIIDENCIEQNIVKEKTED